MKQFSLEEYLKNPERKVVTRDGRSVRIICTDAKNRQPIVVLVPRGDKECIYSYSENGRFYSEDVPSDNDLFFAPQIHKYWGVMYTDPALTDAIVTWPLYATKEEAEKQAGDLCVAEITWEE